MKQKKLSEIVCDAVLDAVLVASIFAFAYGCWLAWKPLGFITLGLLLGAVAVLRGAQIAHESR
jgi:hypothetical protein